MAIRSPAPDSPFLVHALDGWAPEHPHIRFPVTCGMYEEGENLALFLTPASLRSLTGSLGIPANDLALVLSDCASLQGARTIRWTDIAGLGLDVDLVHLPEGADLRDLTDDELPTPLLASPDIAVAHAHGGKVAISLQDGCHGAVIARDRSLLARCLSGFLEEYVLSALSRESTLPPLPPEGLDPLLEPLPPGAFFGLQFQARRRYWYLDAQLQGAGNDDARYRWVCEGEGGRWRPGWSW